MTPVGRFCSITTTAMNNVNLERIPLPRFSTYLIYTAVSLVGSITRLCYVVSHAPHGSPNVTEVFTGPQKSWSPLVQVCVEDTWFFWSLINFAYCLLICLGRQLQHFFFGELRAAENSHIRENLSNFIFYKVVFVYGILNVEDLHELLLWAAWFSALGFLHLLAALAKDRFEFLMQSPDAPLFHVPMLVLLCALLFLGNILMAVSIAVGTRYSIHLMFFMLAEVFQLSVRTIHVIVWYAIQLYSKVAHTMDINKLYHKSTSLYYVEMIFSSIIDLGDLIHNVHLLFWNHLRVNMSGIIVGMHLQHLYYKLSKRYRHHLRYRRVLHLLDFSLKQVQLPDQDCAVCWETLKDARELPCTHAFHPACLHMWLERSTHCPTCRAPLDALEATETTENRDLSTRVRITTTVSSSHPGIQSHGDMTVANSMITTHGLSGSECDTDSDALREEQQHRVDSFGTCSSRPGYNSSSGNMFFPVPDYGNSSDAMSAMVSINRLLDVPNEPHNGPGGVGIPTHSHGSTLPARFFDALEAELLQYFQPPSDSHANEDTHSSRSPAPTNLHDPKLRRRSTRSTTRTTAIPTQPTVTTVGDDMVEQSQSLEGDSNSQTPVRSEGLFSQSQSVNHLEFPPKRVLRMAIRHLIHRVTQAAAAARAVGAHVTSRQVFSSDEDSCSPERTNRSQSNGNQPHQPSRSVQSPAIRMKKTPTVFADGIRTTNPVASVFHGTRELREQSLEQRKLAIRAEAKRNFLLRCRINDP